MQLENCQMEFDTAVCNPAEERNELFSLQSFILSNDISISKVEKIESNLDFYEKFSLVFLLYDNSELELAYQKLEVAYTEFCEGNKDLYPVSQWAREHAGDINWNERFIEALGIIQNYKVLHDIGYSRNDMRLKYLPENGHFSSYVDLMRKALYRICEGLTLDKARRLIELVNEDITRESQDEAIPRTDYSPEFLEIYLLHWHSLQYLTIGSSSVRNVLDIKKLAKHLKVLEEEDLCEYIKLIQEKSNSCTSESTFLPPESDIRTSSHSPVHGSHSIVSTSPYGGLSDDTSVYPINTNSMGKCVIINQKYFYEDPDPLLKLRLPQKKLETRLGTDIDESRLLETFMALGFQNCEVGRDLTHTQIIATLHSAASQFSKQDSCFVLCILTHGKKDQVYGSNSIPVEISQIEDIISRSVYPNLLGKPKIIIIQSCQGSDPVRVYRNTDIEEDGLPTTRLHPQDNTLSELSDQVRFWSTVPGFASFRHPQNGSWFIEMLTSELLMQKPQMEILTIFRNVIRKLSSRKAFKDDEWVGMTPQTSFTLRKTLYLPLRHEVRFHAARRLLLRHMFNTLLDEFIRANILHTFRHHATNTSS